MKVVRKINNNVAICVDGKGNELVAFGRGIGFPAMPYVIDDLDKVDKTFYNISSNLLNLINELPEDIVEFSARMVNKLNNLDYELNQNVVLTLADHIEFSLERYRKKITIQMPLSYEVQQRYPEELKIGRYILKEINQTFHVKLNSDEAVGIALNLVAARKESKNESDSKLLSYEKQVIEEITQIIERELDFFVDRESFNYTRFATHLQYLIQRLNGSQCIDSDNQAMYDSADKEFKNISQCVDVINIFFHENFNCTLTEEERLYLILHINRVYAKEGL